ncbi:MAG: Asp-tRNA(Asn)/Glu-tRNA(Gln) amidotransferase subunit GatA [Deltaproteobacteria bacterium]|nr:Asp-tRNA(Asn)/Glu-tRNA(Gln) amidotransferase subunit GatA [Deltaproteobacteria bacterium]
MSLTQLTLAQLHEKIKSKEVSSKEATQAQFKRIRDLDSKVQAYLTLCEDAALKQAEALDSQISKGLEVKPLTGVPFALKDIFVTQGIQTTCASKILENYIPPYNGTAVQKLLDAGIVLTGKLNMDEFAMGSSTETSAYKKTRNPWDLERTPGGSSGGSSAAIAADLCFATLGTDTGGSIRQPAALTSTVGLKPTYGRVSRYGVIAFASSLDQVGPMTKEVRDAALVLNAIAGFDPKDSTSVNTPVPDYTKALTGEVKGVRIGIPKEYFVSGMDKEIEESVREAIKVYEKLGAVCEEVSLPHTEYGVATYYIIAPAEASSNLARYDGVRYGHRSSKANTLEEMYRLSRSEGFGAEVKRRIMLGTYVLSAGYYDAYYIKAQKVRTLIRQDFEAAFKKFDVLLTPVTPNPAFKIGEKTSDPLAMYLSDIFTINVNLAGLPGMSLPCGFTRSGLPIGMQLLAKPFAEEKIFQAAYAYEQNTEWHLRKAKI